MKKRCIWNWDKKKKIECLDEKRKRSRFFVVLSFWGGIVIEIGIPIIILIVLLLDAKTNICHFKMQCSGQEFNL